MYNLEQHEYYKDIYGIKHMMLYNILCYITY